MSAEDEVRQASDRFYAAFNQLLAGDAGPMRDTWSHTAEVTAMHPLGGRQVGWEQVRAGWEQTAQIAGGGQLRLDDPLVHAGTDMAYVVGIERGEGTLAGQTIQIDQRVTFVYRREAGAWKIVHHHTDISPAMLDLVRRLQAQPGQATT